MPIFDLTIPEKGHVPVIVEVPHAGLAVPEPVRSQIAAPYECVLRDADIYVDKLYARAPEAGATLLTATVSRYVVDLNRAPDDVDAETVPDHPSPRAVQPRGVVWRVTTDGRPALTRPLTHLELSARLDTYHRPYHDTLREQLERTRSRFGHAILIAGHSMPSIGRAAHIDPGNRRADVVPGTRGRTTAHPRIIDLVDAHFRAAGLSVRHDDPYRGGWTTGFYGRPESGWHAIQIEINRGLYVNEATGEPKRGDFERVQELLVDLIAKLGRIGLR